VTGTSADKRSAPGHRSAKTAATVALVVAIALLVTHGWAGGRAPVAARRPGPGVSCPGMRRSRPTCGAAGVVAWNLAARLGVHRPLSAVMAG
jgi:hypothetical protein